jgi:retron-type reverse transcriptase
VLQCDIKKYFPSIDLEILKQIVRRKIKCQDTLWLIDKIIDNSNEQLAVTDYFPGDDLLTPLQRRKGLPLGNLTSQFFANCYLNGLDHFITENLKFSSYLRYVDDFAMFAQEAESLADAKVAIEKYLEQLRLKIHPIKSQVFETKYGVNFVGFRVFPQYIRVRRENLRRARRRFKCLQTDYAQGKIDLLKMSQSLTSWVAHLQHGDTWKLRQKIFNSLVFTRN